MVPLPSLVLHKHYRYRLAHIKNLIIHVTWNTILVNYSCLNRIGTLSIHGKASEDGSDFETQRETRGI